MLLICMFR